MAVNFSLQFGGTSMILRAIAEKLKRRSKDDFKGRHFEASLILQAVCWYLRYPLSYRDIEELFFERGLAVTTGLRPRSRYRCGALAASASSLSGQRLKRCYGPRESDPRRCLNRRCRRDLSRH